MIAPRAVLAALALGLLPAAAGALTERPVLPAGAGPQRLEVDAALLAGSAGGALADLRLRDAAGREVPYLLVPPASPEGRWLPGRLLPVHATRAESGLEVDLGQLARVDRLQLLGLPEPFLKRCRLEGSGDRRRWTVLQEEATLFGLPDEQLRQLELAFAPGDYRYLRLTWDDRMSARLPLPAAASAHAPPAGAAPPPPTAPVAFTRRASEPGVSRFRLALPGPHLPVVALVLEAGGERLHREARVLQAGVQGDALVPLVLGQATLRRVRRAGATAEALRIPVERPAEPELELRVTDGDNPPLDLRGVSVELAPQPWIYLESPDGAPLTASYGDPARARPAYDLEAQRAELGAARPAAARWGPARAAAAALQPEAAADPGPAGPVERARFTWSRPVPPGPPGLAALLLDAEVLARSPELSDLRLADGQGRQVPYLLERREEPLSLPLTLRPAGTRDGVSRYTVALPAAALPAGRLVLEADAAGRVFERRVAVLAEAEEARRHRLHRDAGEGPREEVCAEGLWRHARPEEAAPPLTLDLPAGLPAEVVVRVDEGDNQPLRLASARLLLPTRRLRFFHPGPPLTLLYGDPEAHPPRYDLALLAPRLRGAAAREVALPPPGPGEAPADRRAALPWVFWGVLVVAVAALLLVLRRLLRGEGPPPGGAG